MFVSYNPLKKANGTNNGALQSAPSPDAITFDLPAKAIYAKGVKFLGTDTTYEVFKKHTSAGTGGHDGLVPAPSFTTSIVRFLREDGTWQAIPGASELVGATATEDGIAGTAPLPLIKDRFKFLRGDGTWSTPTYRPIKFTMGTNETEVVGDDLDALNLKTDGNISYSKTEDTDVLHLTIGINIETLKTNLGVNQTVNYQSTHDLIPTSKSVYEAIQYSFRANDAMVYKGTYTATANTVIYLDNFSTPPDGDSLGWTWRIVGLGYFGNIPVEPGDIIIAHVDNPGTTVTNYDVILTNLVLALTLANTGGTDIANDSKRWVQYDATADKLYITLNTTVLVQQSTGDNVEYPLIWSDLTNTDDVWAQQLFKSYDKLTFNPKRLDIYAKGGFRVDTGRLVNHDAAGNGFIMLNGAGADIAELAYFHDHAFFGNYYGSTENSGIEFFDSGNFSIFTKGTKPNKAIYGTNAGNIGIGLLPTYKLDVDGIIYTSDRIAFPHGGNAAWSRISERYEKNSIRVMSTAGETAANSPSNYAIGLLVDGYYSMGIAAYGGGDSETFWIRNNENTWRTLLHNGNTYFGTPTNSSVPVTINGTTYNFMNNGGYIGTTLVLNRSANLALTGINTATFSSLAMATNYTDVWSDGTNSHPWYGYDHRYGNTGVYSTTITDYFGLTLKTSLGNISMTNAGDVGIGTTSPGYKLHVTGTIYATGQPGFYADVAAGNWAYLRLRSGGANLWDVAVNSSRAYALEFRAGGGEPTMWLDYAGQDTAGGLIHMRNGLEVIDNSSNNDNDALALFRHQSNNDWTVVIDSGNYDYGLDIRNGTAGKYALRVGSDALRVTGLGKIATDGVRHILNGPTYTCTTSSITGAITIRIPHFMYTMFSFWVDVYNYATNTMFSVHCGGYVYDSGTMQHNPAATVYGANHNVRYGHDGSYNYIYIGETNSTWSYPQVVVRDILLGYSGDRRDRWFDADILFSTSFASTDFASRHYAITTKNVGNMYWANVPVSLTSNAGTAPTFSYIDCTRVNDHGINVGTIRGKAVGSRGGQYIHLYERVHIGSPNGWGSNDAPSYGLSTYGGIVVNQGGTSSGNYNEGIRLKTASNGWANIQFGTDASNGGQISGLWIVGRNPSAYFEIAPTPKHSSGTTRNATGGIMIDTNGNLQTGSIVSTYNNSWLSPSRLQIGRYDSTSYTDRAVIGVTNGNLHLDSYSGYSMYLNHYVPNNVYLCTGGGSVGIGHTTTSYKLDINGDSLTRGWCRASTGFYCEGYGVHYSYNSGGIGLLYLSGTGYCVSVGSGNTLNINSVGQRWGNVANYYTWYGGNTSTYAGHTVGHLSACTYSTDVNPNNASIELREYYRQTTSCTHGLAQAPRLGFHWGGRYWAQIVYFDSIFRFMNNALSGYVNVYASHYYEESDIRKKNILKYLNITSDDLSNIPLFDFEWKENPDGIYSGTSALAVQEILPNLVSGKETLTLDYGALGTIAGITACKELVIQKSEIEQLRERVAELEKKLNDYGIA